MSRPKIVLDCDPGVDDMFAIFCALKYCDLVAVTTVAGNVSIEHTTRNALGILELAGRAVPVHRGAAGPLDGTLADDAAHVHGETGLGGVDLPPLQTEAASDDAAQAILDLTAGGDVALVAVGPLTNVAMALQQDPGLAQRLPQLVIMGGSTDIGNVTSHAEFNIWADPEAAEVVFTSGVPLTMAGLNLTRQVTMGATEIKALRDSGTTAGVASANALDYYSDFSLKNYGVKLSSMHDPCAVLQVSHPDVFESAPMAVSVETAGHHTRGMTVCDQRSNAESPNTSVMVRAERDRAVDLIVRAAISPRG